MTALQIINDTANKCNHLECDGTTKVLHYVMNEHEIKHTVFVGTVNNNETRKRIPLHYWIELPNKMIVDYKCRMWLGDDAPHGIFKPESCPNFEYDGKPIELKVPKMIYQILMDEF